MMMSIFLIPFYLLSLNSGNYHEIYLSVLELDEQQMSIKVFTDNLQDAIRNNTSSFVPSDDQRFPEANKSAIENYFQETIKLHINGNEMGFNLREISLKGDSYWIMMNLNSHQTWKSFRLEASYLMELFPDQTNVVKVFGKRPQFFRLTKDSPTCSSSFSDY